MKGIITRNKHLKYKALFLTVCKDKVFEKYVKLQGPKSNIMHYGMMWKVLSQEQDKSSDIEQQPPFGNCKYSNTLPQMRGGGAQNQRETYACEIWKAHLVLFISYEQG